MPKKQQKFSNTSDEKTPKIATAFKTEYLSIAPEVFIYLVMRSIYRTFS